MKINCSLIWAFVLMLVSSTFKLMKWQSVQVIICMCWCQLELLFTQATTLKRQKRMCSSTKAAFTALPTILHVGQLGSQLKQFSGKEL